MSRYLRGIGALVLIAFMLQSFISAEEFNGTTYRLTGKFVEVFQPVDASRLNITLQDKAANITLLDADGRNVGLKSGYTFWRGDYTYNLVFDKHICGQLVYTLPYQGQAFILSMQDDGPVRIILPPGYTTGDRLLGLARPNPDDIRADKDGTSLTWLNTSGHSVIAVDYYKTGAPGDLKRFFSVIAIAALVLFAEYYASIRRLRAIREKAERSMKY